MTTYVNSASASTGATGGTSTSLAVTRPSGWTAGNVALIWMSLTGSGVSVNPSAPSGWTQIGSAVDTGSPSSRGFLWKREIDGTSLDSPTITWTGGGEAVAVYGLYGEADYDAITGRVDVHGGTGTARTTGTLNTSVTSWIVHGFGDRNGSTFTAYTGTLRQEPRISSSASAIFIDSNGDVAAGNNTRTATGAATSIGVSFIASIPTGTSVVVDAGEDQTVEPWSQVTLTASPVEATWSQISGTTVTLGGSGNVRTFTAPPTLDGEALTFRATASSVTDDVVINVLAVNERAIIGGQQVPIRILLA